jgi:hypothetical protein
MPKNAPPCPRSPDGKHAWQSFALGRICTRCYLVQTKGEYDETGEDVPAA